MTLTREEEQVLEEYNKGHRVINAVRDCLEAGLDFSLPDSDLQLMTATEVLNQVGIERPTNPQTRDCGSYLREKVGEPTKSKGKTRWRVPVKKYGFPTWFRGWAGGGGDGVSPISGGAEIVLIPVKW